MNSVQKTIAILDGDLYISEAEKMERIQSVITGQAYDYQRQQVLHAILQYQLPAQTSLNHLLEIQFWHYQIMFFQNTMNFV